MITPIDKATGNIALICKRFYAEVLVNELGFKGEGPATYTFVRKTDDKIVGQHKKVFKEKFSL